MPAMSTPPESPPDKSPSSSPDKSPEKSPSSWTRRKSDPLEEPGFASKGDTKLLSYKAQNAYFNKIVDRYVTFCAKNSLFLDRAFGALPRVHSEDPTKNPPVALSPKSGSSRKLSKSESGGSESSGTLYTSIGTELSLILVAMRKLREAILVTDIDTPLQFQQRVHVFCIRAGILSEHPPSYYPPLKRLLYELHTEANPLQPEVLDEMTTYMLLDVACRQCTVEVAYEMRIKARAEFGYENPIVDDVLRAVLYENWAMFWRVRNAAEGYSRALIDWASEWIRWRALKVIAKTYTTVPLEYLMKCCTGDENGMTWEELVEKEGLGWLREGDNIVIRRLRPKIIPK